MVIQLKDDPLALTEKPAAPQRARKAPRKPKAAPDAQPQLPGVAAQVEAPGALSGHVAGLNARLPVEVLALLRDTLYELSRGKAARVQQQDLLGAVLWGLCQPEQREQLVELLSAYRALPRAEP